jgi:hypothetical protein
MAFSLNSAILESANDSNLRSAALAFWIWSEAIILADNLTLSHSMAARIVSFADVKLRLIKANSLSIISDTSVSKIIVCSNISKTWSLLHLTSEVSKHNYKRRVINCLIFSTSTYSYLSLVLIKFRCFPFLFKNCDSRFVE